MYDRWSLSLCLGQDHIDKVLVQRDVRLVFKVLTRAVGLALLPYLRRWDHSYFLEVVVRHDGTRHTWGKGRNTGRWPEMWRQSLCRKALWILRDQHIQQRCFACSVQYWHLSSKWEWLSKIQIAKILIINCYETREFLKRSTSDHFLSCPEGR